MFLNNKIFTDKHSAQYKTYSSYKTKFFQLLHSLLLAASIFSVVLWDNHEDGGSNLLRKVRDKITNQHSYIIQKAVIFVKNAATTLY